MNTARSLVFGLGVVAVSCGTASRAPSSTISPTDASAPDVAAQDAVAPPAGSPPIVPVGEDAYRDWALLPTIRIGARTYMRSTYDRAGGNEAADASHYLRENAPGDDVALDVTGKGVLTFFRANHWHGSPWHFGVDGADQVVSESATATPDSPPPTSTFLPVLAFPSPLALTYATTQGADVSWVPMGFTRSLSIAHGRTHYGTGYFIYSLYDPDAPLSTPVTAWSTSSVPSSDVVSLLASAGSDIAPTGAGVTGASGTVDVPATGAVTLADLKGPSTLRVLRLIVPTASSAAIETARVRVTWDGRAAPSIDSPVPLFFGAGTLFNRNSAEYLVKSLPAVIRFTAAGIELSTYWPMPFQRSAHVELVGGGAAAAGIAWQMRSVPNTDPPGDVGLFHATYVDHGTPSPGRDLIVLDTTRTEGGGDWCGSFVGTSFIFSDQANLGTLEGDPRFFFDDSQSPQGQGTGSEEWGAGGDYWNGGQNTTLPLAGHPVGAPSAQASMGAADLIESAYRFLIADAFPFGHNARIQLEHGGTDDSTEHYRSVAYWYGTPSACLVQTDSLHVGDVADETAHAYSSPGASAVDSLTTRYEWGVDHVGSQEIYPATTDTGRHTTGTTELTIAIRPDNFGVMLRRKLDYGFADQRATVLVADTMSGASFTAAGTWYVAGSNTCAFVDAPTETGVAAPTAETSNRRWGDDEFLVPRSLTRGRDHVRVRIIASGSKTWSEYRYTAYSYVLP